MNSHTQLSEIWEKNFGDEFTDRKLAVHKSEGTSREQFWHDLLSKVSSVKSVVEIGCNAGMNLEAIYKANQKLEITGIEPNKYALKKAIEISNGRYKVTDGNVFDFAPDLMADMIFTCSLLIHISPKDLMSAMHRIYDASNNVILIMEYYWPTLKEIKYRGLDNALWKQDYGALFFNNFDLNIVETGVLDDRDGFDRITWWLFKK